ncbi:DUF6132 family protein [Imtechella halotolerans]|uniref:DUF6132 family protein n=1 Tax=Imtechella halotolerans TaxID=1165090 RepID=UPI00030721C0|nr:DUF6132 family protein [Imtechella halotolerans]WMQ63013.1 DUF6132 family protein [Imtechella halotolerans]
MKILNKKVIFTSLGALFGAIMGYAYYYFIGCVSGTCPITSRPFTATVYGAFMGGLLFNTFIRNPSK